MRPDTEDMRRRLTLLLAALALGAAVTPVPPASAGVMHLSEPHALTAGTVAPRIGSAYSFSAVLDGKPIRWNPCAPIHWQFRGAGAPTGGLTITKQSVARIARATGTTWVFDGVVPTAPSTSWLPRTSTGVRPLLIGWADAASSDLLRGQPRGVLGVTRTAWFGMTRDGRSVAALRAAVIALDRSDRLPLNGALSWRTVLLHELGHAMGLDHATSSRQLMNAVLQPTLADLQAGDLEGLARVGRSAGCVVLAS